MNKIKSIENKIRLGLELSVYEKSYYILFAPSLNDAIKLMGNNGVNVKNLR